MERPVDEGIPPPLDDEDDEDREDNPLVDPEDDDLDSEEDT